MIKNLINSFKESSNQTIVLTLVFCAGVLLSAYQLFMLPHNLLYYGNVANVSLATTVFVKLSSVVIGTLLIGIFTVAIAIKTKKETIVYLEKQKIDETQQENQRNDSEEQNKIDKELFASMINENEEQFLQQALNKVCGLIQAGQGAIYRAENNEGKRELELSYGFALAVAETAAPRFEFGEGLLGQVAASGKSVYLDEVPEGYITIVSGLGASYPRYLFIFPLIEDEKVKAVMELATFKPVLENLRSQLEQVGSFLASKLD